MDSIKRAKLDLIIAVAAFGTIGIFIRYINLPSSVIALVRGVIGAAFLLLLLYFRKTPFRWAVIQPHWKLLALSGVVISFNWITLFEAYRYTTVTTTTLCYYMAPVFVTLISPVLFHEKLTPIKLLCVLTALCGMVFVSGILQSGPPEPKDATGILLALLSAVCYAGDVSLNKILGQVPAYERTLVQLAVAALVMVPYILLTVDLSAMTVTPLAAFLLVVVGIFHTGWCYSLFFGSMTYLPAQTVVLFSYIDPIVAILLSALLLKEPLGWNGIVGAVLVLGSTLVSELSGRASPEAK